MKFLFDLFPIILFFIAFKLQGIYVATAVAIGSAAADNDINAGAVIVQVRDTVVASPDDVLRSVANERAQKRSSVPMLLSEPDGLRWVAFPLN